MRIIIDSDTTSLLRPLEDIRYYFVGGYVRDKLMKRPYNDIDIIVFEPIETIEEKLQSVAFIVNNRFATARFSVNNRIIDINTVTDLHSDLKRRDFTVNAIAADKTGEIIDSEGGLEDITRHLIRPVSDSVFKDDPLRLMRALRYSADLSFALTERAEDMINRDSGLIRESAPERINEELHKIFSQPGRAYLMRTMAHRGLLKHIFPMLEGTESFEHKKHHSTHLLGHLLNTTEAIDSILNSDIPERLEQYGRENTFILYISALLHDIDKPGKMRKKGDGLSFAGHDKGSAEKASRMLNNLRVSNRKIRSVETLISMHMRPHLLLASRRVTSRGYYRLMRDAGEDLEGLIILTMADKLSSEGIIDNSYIELYERIMDVKNDIEKEAISFITGTDIMDHFSIEEGPLIGDMINSGNEYAVDNNIDSKEKILDFLADEFKTRLPDTD